MSFRDAMLFPKDKKGKKSLAPLIICRKTWRNKYWVLFLNLEAKLFLSQITPLHITAKGKADLKISHGAWCQNLAGTPA